MKLLSILPCAMLAEFIRALKFVQMDVVTSLMHAYIFAAARVLLTLVSYLCRRAAVACGFPSTSKVVVAPHLCP